MYADVGSDKEMSWVNLYDVRDSFFYFILNEGHFLSITVVQI